MIAKTINFICIANTENVGDTHRGKG